MLPFTALPQKMKRFRVQGENTHAGTRPVWIHRDHIVKKSLEPDVEEAISRLFEATKTPGALMTRALKQPSTGNVYSVTKMVPHSKQLNEYGVGSGADEEAERAVKAMGGPHSIADIALSEYLAAVGDRHAGNYLVSPQGIHSIDHELSEEANIEPVRYGALYDSYLPQTHPNHPDKDKYALANPEHLARWDAQIRAMNGRVPKGLEDVNSIDGFHERLAEAKKLAKHFNGYVPVTELGMGNSHLG